MKARHLTTIHELSIEDVAEVLKLSADVKKRPARYAKALAGKTLGMIFQKSSTRTRVSFEVGMLQLGGHALFLSSRDIQIGRGETVSDTAHVLSRYLDGLMARTFSHQDIVDLARFGSVPVINGLDDLVHPCQGLTDYFTVWEKKKRLKGLKMAYVGDGNNMCHSLLAGAVKVGMHFACATPRGYEPKREKVEEAAPFAKKMGVSIDVLHDPAAAVRGADVVYTDTWVSMGQDEERARRLTAFQGFRVSLALFEKAKPDAIFMHCLPAHRGEEVTDEVADHPRSVIFDQAENRLHVQKAILVLLMGKRSRARR